MAARHTARPPQVGSQAWIANENRVYQEMEAQDVEDFAYLARNEMEWLNEHMADIFQRNVLYVTPGCTSVDALVQMLIQWIVIWRI